MQRIAITIALALAAAVVGTGLVSGLAPTSEVEPETVEPVAVQQ